MAAKKILILGTLGWLVLQTTNAGASGFGIFTQGAEALGQANAVVAGGEGPSAVFFNPALLVFTPGTAVEAGTTAVLPRRETTSTATGITTTTTDNAYFPSTLYLTHSTGTWAVGLGVFNPFGLGTDWGETWEGRYLATKSKITTFEINPVVAYQVCPGVSLAAGFEYVLMDAKLRSKVNLNAFGLPDARQKIDATGDGIGFNAALAARGEKIGFGISYRSKKTVDVKGHINFTTPDPAVDPVLPNTTASTRITLPQQLTAGLSYKIRENLAMEAGLRWEDWSSVRNMQFRFGKPVGGSLTATQQKNWHDTMAYNVGVKYRANDMWTLLGGYLYAEHAIPDATFEAAVPDSTSHLFCIGTKLDFKPFILSLGYGLQLQNDRTKSNTIGGAENNSNGEYRSTMHLVAGSIGYHF